MAKKDKIDKELEIIPPYITVELSDRNHVVAHKIIGSHDRFSFVARCNNRNAADRLVKSLNDAERTK